MLMLTERCKRQPLILNTLRIKGIALIFLLPDCWEPEEWFKKELTGLQTIVFGNARDLPDLEMM